MAELPPVTARQGGFLLLKVFLIINFKSHVAEIFTSIFFLVQPLLGLEQGHLPVFLTKRQKV